MEKSDIELTVAVCSYRNPDLLRLCLKSVMKSTAGINAEIVVADGATQEETEMMLREDFPSVRFFPNTRNIGFVGLVNTALEAARGKYILLLNHDIVLLEDTVRLLMDRMKSDTKIGLMGPRLLNFDGSTQPSAFRFYRPQTILYRRTPLKVFGFAKRHLDWFLMKEKDLNVAQKVDWIMGSAHLVSRAAVDKVGHMDQRFFMYMEDVDWCRRFWENGYEVEYYPLAVAYHYHGKGSARGGILYSLFFNRLAWVHIMSALKYFRKYLGKPYPRKD